MKRKKHRHGLELIGYMLLGIVAVVIPARLLTKRKKDEDSYHDHRFI